MFCVIRLFSCQVFSLLTNDLEIFSRRIAHIRLNLFGRLYGIHNADHKEVRLD